MTVRLLAHIDHIIKLNHNFRLLRQIPNFCNLEISEISNGDFVETAKKLVFFFVIFVDMSNERLR